MPELRSADSQSLLGIFFLNGRVSYCQHYFNYLFIFCPLPSKSLCIYAMALLCIAGNSHIYANYRPVSGEEETGKGSELYLHSRRQAHDGKVLQLVLLSCAQFWQALLVGCSVPPTTKIKTQNKIRISLWDKHTISSHQIFY